MEDIERLPEVGETVEEAKREEKGEDQVLEKLGEICEKVDRIVDLLDQLVTLARKAASFSNI